MGWTGPQIEIQTLSPQSVIATNEEYPLAPNSVVTPVTFTVTGAGLDDRTCLLFVRASSDEHLLHYQVVPCFDLLATGSVLDPSLQFKAFFNQRDAGDYHLVAWDAPLVADQVRGQNQSFVKERALKVTAAPGAKTPDP